MASSPPRRSLSPGAVASSASSTHRFSLTQTFHVGTGLATFAEGRMVGYSR